MASLQASKTGIMPISQMEKPRHRRVLLGASAPALSPGTQGWVGGEGPALQGAESPESNGQCSALPAQGGELLQAPSLCHSEGMLVPTPTLTRHKDGSARA